MEMGEELDRQAESLKSAAPYQPSRAEGMEAAMLRYQSGDAEGASLLVEQLSPQVFHFFLAQARDRARAEDLLQDFWLRIHKARHTYRPSEPVLPWAFAIARRVQVDDYRKRSRIARHEAPSDSLPDLAGKSSDRGSTSLQVRSLLKELPESQREAVLLLKVVGLSLEEAARATGSSVGAMKQKAHRAFTTLRKLVARDRPGADLPESLL